MRALLLAVVAFGLVAPSARAQYPFSIAGAWPYGLGTDAAGNTYVLGSFSDQVDVDPSPAVREMVNADDVRDLFLASYSAEGALRYAHHLERHDSGAGPPALAVTDGGQACVAGGFSGTLDLDPSDGELIVTGGTGGAGSVYVVCFSSAGPLVYGTAFDNSVPDQAPATVRFLSLAVDASGGLLMTGDFTGTVDFDPSPEGKTVLQDPEGLPFVAALSPTGELRFAFPLPRVSGTGLTADANAVVPDGQGGFRVVGRFRGGLATDPGPPPAGVLTAVGSRDLFVAAYDERGAYDGSLSSGGHANSTVQELSAIPDAQGGVVVEGKTYWTDFDPWTSGDQGCGSTDSRFVAWYAADALTYVACWRNSGGPTTAGLLDINLAAAPDGGVYVLGVVHMSMDVDPGPGAVWVNAGPVLIALDAQGAFRRVLSLPIGISNRFSYAIPAPGEGLYVAGQLSGPADVDPDPAVTSIVGSGLFIARYGRGTLTASEGAPPSDGLRLTLASANPASGPVRLSLTVAEAGPAEVAAYDALGRRVAVLHEGPMAAGTHPLTLDASGLPAGVYVVRARVGDVQVAQRVTVLR